MLRVSDEQMAALETAQRATFLERVRTFIQPRVTRCIHPNEFETLFGRAQLYGLESERDVIRYIYVAVMVGAAALTSDPEWMERSMQEQGGPTDARLRRLILSFRAHHKNA